MTTKAKSGKPRQRYSQQYKAESLSLAEKVGLRQQPGNWGSMKANCITGGARRAFHKIKASSKSNFWWKMPASSASWLSRPRSWPS